ncbi:excisionase [Escherichia coli]|uniref:Excisionase n=1 Tax=Escherichia coli TaxID=562 RepID=A0A376LMB2_ECOLX|nr:excisionase [Escherichia coli]
MNLVTLKTWGKLRYPDNPTININAENDGQGMETFILHLNYTGGVTGWFRRLSISTQIRLIPI